ncbi:MAG: tetratricopeptide repeat protein [Planctomycetota bacterium]|jgi:tetratricopeptide (TPR) repeat protein|nr:tetratricopeptide repeat protein [Planctomycetota bacterium]
MNMDWYLASVTWLWLVASVASWLAIRHDSVREKMEFYIVGFVILFPSLGFAFFQAFSRAGGNAFGMLAFLTPCAMGALFGAPFLAEGFALALDKGIRFLRGDSSLPAVMTFDQAEALEAQHRWEEAIALYRERLEESPDSREIRMRIAEVYVRSGEIDRAITEYGALVSLAQNEDQKSSTVFRLVDLLVDSDQADRALRVLETFRQECQQVKIQAQIERRIGRLK